MPSGYDEMTNRAYADFAGGDAEDELFVRCCERRWWRRVLR